MAFASVTTKRKTEFGTIEIIQVLSGGAGTGDLILTEGLPFGSAHIVNTSGTGVTSIQLVAGNDGIVANCVELGLVNTQIATEPTLIDITSGVNPAAGPELTQTLSDFPTKYHAWIVAGGDATSVITITEILTSTRG